MTATDGPTPLSAVIRSSRQNGRGKNGTTFLAPDIQQDKIERWCAANNAAVVHWHHETAGRNSGGAKNWKNRRGLQAAMAEALSGQTEGVIVAKVDRFARVHHEGVIAIHELHKAGRMFIAVDDGISGREAKSLGEKIVLDVYLRIAEHRLDELTEGWDETVDLQIAAGIANVCPWGYMRCAGKDAHVAGCTGNDDEKHRRLIPDPDRAPWVRWIFEQRAAGKSWTWIADTLTAKGVAPSNGGKAWSYESARWIVTNRHYLGELRSGERVNPTAHDAIVDRDLFERANAGQGTPTTEAPADAQAYMLHGVLRCASCGARMRGNVQHGARYYRCPGKFSWGRCPRPARVLADEIEGHVMGQFEVDYIQRAQWQGSRSTDKLDAVTRQLRDAEAELNGWLAAPTTKRMRSVMGEAAYEQAMNDRLDDVEAARAQVAEAEGDLLGQRLPGGLADLWPKMDDEARRSLLALVYPVIAVRPTARAEGATRATRWDREHIAFRVRVFVANDPERPAIEALPGRGGVRRIVPIDVAPVAELTGV